MKIIALAAEKLIHIEAADQHISSLVAEQPVLARTSDQHVVAAAAEERTGDPGAPKSQRTS